ncbi:GNAT family N-acetyltransferase [Vreelandella utahensis]|uniref:GNAT family N-acetyltransferase n=1 Tax=Vreelandella halophila TaxID=86177 RepID=UPI000986E5D9|nr:N-acetyltransferase [Halomonas utahensis]
MELHPAQQSDLLTVLSWVNGEHECLMWAGPNIQYPATPETAWRDMEASEGNAYVLVDPASKVVGFGQILSSGGSALHLARLIVEPRLRGQGVGRDLCAALMDIGSASQPAEYVTLNVYESNRAAVRLYQSLGFEIKDRDDSGAVAMVKIHKEEG